LQKEIQKLNATLEEKIKIAIEKNKKDQLIMMQQSRLAQMGEVLSMIAHQWKQPLNSLSILNSTIVSKYKNGNLTLEAMQKFEEKSKNLIQRMSKTIDDFRTFFKPEKDKRVFYIHDTIEHSFELMRPILKHNRIKLSVNLEQTKHKILGYPNELSQAIINIISNSKDALIENGIKDKKISVTLKYSRNRAILTIEDNGGGVQDEEVLSKIFDPYFTTKSDKNGAGIGLYMTKIIIEKHMNGKIESINSDNGLKTIITLGVFNEQDQADK
jgi:signal transduction histidine kinase